MAESPDDTIDDSPKKPEEPLWSKPDSLYHKMRKRFLEKQAVPEPFIPPHDEKNSKRRDDDFVLNVPKETAAERAFLNDLQKTLELLEAQQKSSLEPKLTPITLSPQFSEQFKKLKEKYEKRLPRMGAEGKLDTQHAIIIIDAILAGTATFEDLWGTCEKLDPAGFNLSRFKERFGIMHQYNDGIRPF